jgi:glycosyltransferase involved in cell wall biosynthesis
MRILHTVEYYAPSIGGAQEVVRQISERLVKRGHSVTVATTRLPERTEKKINGVDIAEFDVSGNAIRGFQGEVERYHGFLMNSPFDLMMNYAAQQWATDLVFPVLPRIPYRKVMVPCGFSGLYRPSYVEYFKRMPEHLRAYDHLIFHSDRYRDIQFAREHGITRLTVIPNGASEEEFSNLDPTFRGRYGIPDDVPMLLTVGGHTGLKGHDATIKAFLKAKIGRSVLVLNGNVPYGTGCLQSCRRRTRMANLLSFGRKRVLLLNAPRKDVVAAYHAADLFVFPSNIECSPLVLYEAMASRTPFLATDIGNCAEIVEWGGGGRIVKTVYEEDGYVRADVGALARDITEMLRNREDSRRIGESGHRAWRERFTWEKIERRYEALYDSVVSGKEAGDVDA